MFTLFILSIFINSSGELESSVIDVIKTDTYRECNQKGEDYPVPSGILGITWSCVEINYPMEFIL